MRVRGWLREVGRRQCPGNEGPDREVCAFRGRNDGRPAPDVKWDRAASTEVTLGELG